MATKLREVDLNSGRLKKLVVVLNDNNDLIYELHASKDNGDRPTENVVLNLSEQQVDLILKIAAHR